MWLTWLGSEISNNLLRLEAYLQRSRVVCKWLTMQSLTCLSIASWSTFKRLQLIADGIPVYKFVFESFEATGNIGNILRSPCCCKLFLSPPYPPLRYLRAQSHNHTHPALSKWFKGCGHSPYDCKRSLRLLMRVMREIRERLNCFF